MSRPKTIGFAIVQRIEEIPELAGKVVFFRRSDIESEFTKRMSKGRGLAVIVRLVGAPNLTPEKQTARFGGNYTVALFTSPTLTAKDAKDTDALMQEIADKLHGWWPEEVPSNGLMRCACGTITFPEDPQYDVAALPVEAPATSKK